MTASKQHTNETHIVVYKPKHQSTKEYMVIIDDVEEYKKWLAGDHSIALAMFSSNGLIYASETGSQGKWLTPAAQELSSDFSATNDDGEEVDEEGKPEKKGKKAKSNATDDAIKVVLEKGELKTTKHIGTGGAEMNPSRGGGQQTGAIGQPGR